MEVGDTVIVDGRLYGVDDFTAIVSQTYEVPYVSVRDYAGDKFYVPTQSVMSIDEY